MFCKKIKRNQQKNGYQRIGSRGNKCDGLHMDRMHRKKERRDQGSLRLFEKGKDKIVKKKNNGNMKENIG